MKALLKNSRDIKFAIKLFIVAVLLEITVFQFASYHLLFGNYQEKTVFPAEADILSDVSYQVNDGDKSVQIMGTSQVVFDFNDLGYEIGTVKVNLEFAEGTDRTQLTMDMADETQASPRQSIASAVIVKENERSHYVNCQFSGKVSDLSLKFNNYDEDNQITVKSIEFNKRIPFHISLFRILFIVILGTLFYAIIYSEILGKKYQETEKFCRVSAVAVTALMVLLIVVVIIVKLPEGGLASEFKLEQGNQITKEIVDAFEHKQVSLLDKPSQEFMSLQNPYDWSQRDGIDAKWDHVYRNGKYYSYYGIAPVVTVFLPYHLITGYYFSTDIAVGMFSALGLVFLCLAYLSLIERWFKKIPSGCVLAGLIILLSSCGIWYSVGRTLFYEISISSGFMFMTIAAYCLISSNLLSEGKISLPKIALSSLCFGLAVLSRPTLAVYAVCAAVFYLYRIVVDYKNKVKISNLVKLILCAGLPLFLCAVTQMWYNYVRFGSVLDFGIEYSVTINDFVHNQFYMIFVLIGLFNYLFAVPEFSTGYPYIKTTFSTLDVNGYYFHDDGNVSGIIFLALPVIGYIFSKRALNKLSNRKEKIKYAVMVGMPCVLMPLVIICSIWESGYAVRYTADFSWEITIGALIVLFFLYVHSNNGYKKGLFKKFMAVSMVLAIVINGMQIFDFTFPESSYPEICSNLQNIVAFWK